MEGALERFSDRFVSPLFPEKYVTKEVNAVNSEHQKNIMNDYWRLFRISSFLSREGHPAKKFQTGNLETLGDVTRAEVVSFFEKQISKNHGISRCHFRRITLSIFENTVQSLNGFEN